MKKEKNNFIKISIVLVITSLALLAIVYVMQKSTYSDDSFAKVNQTVSTNEESVERHEFTAFGKTFSYEGDGEVIVDAAAHVEFYGRTDEELADLLEQGVDHIRVIYDEDLYMSRNLYAISGIYKGFDPNEINYKCDGTFVKSPRGMMYLKEIVHPKEFDVSAKIIYIDDNDRWADCETDGLNYLKQFEFDWLGGEPALFTGGGENVKTWNLVYVKRIDKINYFFPVSIGATHFFYDNKDVYSPQEYCLENGICYDKSSKKYLEILLADKELQKKIAEWDKFVQSLELVK